MYKRIYKTLIVILAAFLVFTGCTPSNENKDVSNENMFTIVTSFYPMYVHTINIANNIPGVNVVNLTEPQTGCLHDYSMTPNDLKVLESAKVFVVNGAGMESFMDKVINQLPNLKVIDASMGIELIEDEHDHAHEESNDEDYEEGNPHVWVSITNAMKQVENIGEQLAAADPNNAEAYKTNAEAYVKKLQLQKEKMHKALDVIKGASIITFHEAFPYFAKEFNLKIAAVVEREPGSEPSAEELANTINIVKSQKVKALFAEPQYSSKSAETIARETGIKLYTLDPGVTGEANEDTDAYIKMMDKNLEVLEEALK